MVQLKIIELEIFLVAELIISFNFTNIYSTIGVMVKVNQLNLP